MILFGLLTALVTLFAAGFGATVLLMRGSDRRGVLECSALGWLFGCGIVSVLLAIGGLFLSGAILQIGVAASALILGALGFASMRRERARFSWPRPRNALEWILAAAIALEIFALFYSAFAHGLGWDGLLNWEVKARYAFFNDGVMPAAYYRSETRAFTHPAYPLLIPLSELWLYLWMGEPHQFWIKLLFPLFYAAGAIVLVSLARRLTNRCWPGLVAAALLFYIPCLTNSPGDAAGGYADVPLSMFYLVAVGYLLVYAVNGEMWSLRVFAISLALLPWTKREGVILWAIVAGCGALVLFRRRVAWPAFFWLLPGAVLISAWNIFLHLMHTTEAREFVPMTLQTLWANWPRIIPLGRMVLEEMLATSRWSLFWPGVAFAFAILAVRRRDWRFYLLGAAVGAPIVLYTATYLFSSWPDYSLHFRASFSRLLLQVVPTGWLAISLAIAEPSAVVPPPDSSGQSRSR